MENQILKKRLVIFTATFTMVIFNGFAYVEKPKTISILEKVNEASRISHAKELLGSSYFGSDAHSWEGKTSFNKMIHKTVRESLDKSWQKQARSIARTIIKESTKYKLDPVFVLAVIRTESKFNPLALGRFGEIGLMQIKPTTAEWIAGKFNLPWNGKKTLKDPVANIQIGLAYMSYLRGQFKGSARKYVSAYNMGPKNLNRLWKNKVTTFKYSSMVMQNYDKIYSRLKQKPDLVAIATR